MYINPRWFMVFVGVLILIGVLGEVIESGYILDFLVVVGIIVWGVNKISRIFEKKKDSE